MTRKKQQLALLAMILAGVVAMLVFGSRNGTAWTLASVDATLRKAADDPKIQINSIGRLSGDIQANRHPILNRLSQALRQRPLYRDITQYTIHNGIPFVWVTIYQTDNLVHSVEISTPAKYPSKLAERLHSDLTAAHPGLPCSIKKP